MNRFAIEFSRLVAALTLFAAIVGAPFTFTFAMDYYAPYGYTNGGYGSGYGYGVQIYTCYTIEGGTYISYSPCPYDGYGGNGGYAGYPYGYNDYGYYAYPSYYYYPVNYGYYGSNTNYNYNYNSNQVGYGGYWW
jgi:hypothetical protein